MSFDRVEVAQLLAQCRRHCCICGRFCGLKIETDHMDPDGGDNIENAIPVCFDCHAEIHSYNDRHPRGRKFTLEELRLHKEHWLKLFADFPSVLIERQLSDIDVGPVQALIDEIEFNIAAARAAGNGMSGCPLRDEQFSRSIHTGSLSLLIPTLKDAIIAAYIAVGHATVIGQAAAIKKAGGLSHSLSGGGASSNPAEAFRNCETLLSKAHSLLLRFLGQEDKVFSMDEQVRERLLADGVRRESISPYVRAWRWAESGKPSTGLAESTIRTYESDSQRVYRLLGKSTNKQ